MDQDTALQKARALIGAIKMATLCTITPEGLPYATTVYIIADERLKLHFFTKADTAKWRHIQNDPRVAIVVADDDAQETFQLQGKASREEDSSENIAATNKIAAVPKAPFWSLPIDRINAGDYVLVKIEPTWARFSSFEAETPVFVQLV